jgi:hypothetical protein
MVRAWRIDESNLDENKLEVNLDETKLQLFELDDVKRRTGITFGKVWKLCLKSRFMLFRQESLIVIFIGSQLTDDTYMYVFQLNADTYNDDGSLDKIRKESGYSYEDEIEVSSDKLPNFDVMVGGVYMLLYVK